MKKRKHKKCAECTCAEHPLETQTCKIKPRTLWDDIKLIPRYIVTFIWFVYDKFRFMVLHMLFPINKRTDWAWNELVRAGMTGKGSEAYGGIIADACMDLYRVMQSQGHSGFSNSYTLEVFKMLRTHKNLSPLTNDPEEWGDVSNYNGGVQWYQSLRNPSCFSDDNLMNYYNIDEGKRVKGKYIKEYHKLVDINNCNKEDNKPMVQGVP